MRKFLILFLIINSLVYGKTWYKYVNTEYDVKKLEVKSTGEYVVIVNYGDYIKIYFYGSSYYEDYNYYLLNTIHGISIYSVDNEEWDYFIKYGHPQPPALITLCKSFNYNKKFERIDYFILTIYSYEHSQKIYELVLIDSGNDDSYIDEFNKTITPEQRLRD